MFITVRLLNGYSEPLSYSVPSQWPHDDLIGRLVKVPLRKKIEPALVIGLHQEAPGRGSFKIREALELEPFPYDPHFIPFLKKIGDYYALDTLEFYQRIGPYAKISDRDYVPHATTLNLSPVLLTQEQQSIVEQVLPTIIQARYETFVIHGVTGSGKTVVYEKLIEATFQERKTVLFLLPDVSLAVQFTNLFRARFPQHAIFGFHCATGAPEKKMLWQQLVAAQPCLIFGVHLPVGLPISNLGLIIVDEEHDPGFQEKKHPRLQSKDLAILRAQLYNVPLVLGSATPSLSTLYNVHHRGWKLFSLTKRFSGEFPQIKVVPLLDKLLVKKRRVSFWISNDLKDALADRLAKKEQSIIFINRRGYSFFVQCANCGFIFVCSNCSVSLTYHEGDKLCCHYCGFTQELVSSCTACNHTTLLKKGIGTQQVVSLLQTLFPDMRIGRADLDATINKKKWQETMRQFEAGELDVLVGTQTIIKGYHFPRVTLVGVIWADSNINLPFYHAAETTLQQLIQVAGRAGRERPDSLVIIQTMAEHPLFAYINETKYLEFYQQELAHRQALHYPPYGRLACLEVRCSDETIVEQDASFVAQLIRDYIEKDSLGVTVLGPARPLVHKVNNTFARIIHLKGHNARHLVYLYKKALQAGCTSKLFFTQNPLN